MADIYLAIIARRLTGAGAMSRRAAAGREGGSGGAPAQVRPHCVSSTRFS